VNALHGGGRSQARSPAVRSRRLDPKEVTPKVLRHTMGPTWFYARQTKDFGRLARSRRLAKGGYGAALIARLRRRSRQPARAEVGNFNDARRGAEPRSSRHRKAPGPARDQVAERRATAARLHYLISPTIREYSGSSTRNSTASFHALILIQYFTSFANITYRDSVSSRVGAAIV